jgi:hypothetical protein
MNAKFVNKKLMESLKEAVNIEDFRGGWDRKEIVSKLHDAVNKKDIVKTKNGNFKIVAPIRSTQLKEGDYFIGSYNSYNQGADVYRFNGITGDDVKYGEGDIKFKSVKDCLKFYQVKSLKELEALQDENEYGFHSYMNVTDINNGDTGSWFYVYKGRWSRGSDAEALTFTLLQKID